MRDFKTGIKKYRFDGGGMGKGISKKEGVFHLKVCHIHCSLR